MIWLKEGELRRETMKRKEFLRKTLQAGLASWSLLLFERRTLMAKSKEKKTERKLKDKNQAFKEAWIVALMANMDEQFDEKTRAKLMESCGRDCARRGSIRMAESARGDVGKLVQSLANILGKKNCFMDGNVVHLGYDKCYCELVAEGPERLSDTYCNCSTGWVLEMFETAAQKPVEVELLQTIKRGAPSCRFLVRV
jgi:predicted hydrocarbon binding protein